MQTIGRFKVGKELGSGAQGSVYLCGDPKLQRRVAIKLLKRSLFGGEAKKKDLLREARAISQIQHPNIVAIFDVGEEKGTPFLVFEYIEGELLSEHLKNKALDLPKMLNIFEGMLSGVDQVHRQGIVHRDLKPSNVILNKDGVPKIMDFGIASVLSSPGKKDAPLIGTPRYMAPEYIADKNIGTQADVFALGAMLFEMVTGQHAFKGSTEGELLINVTTKSVPAPSTINPEIGERLDAIILKALEKDPQRRFGTAGEMLVALLEYREHVAQKQEVTGTSQGTVDFLLRRMRHKSDFPALSESIRTLNRLVASEEEDVSHLASAILRDFALTNKILKVVNSAYYSRFAGKIGTISRAIVVLGVQPIRSIAASLIFFEHLHNKSQLVKLKNEVASALFAATLARQAALDQGLEDPEEGFLCGMLYNLGQILVTYYLHDEGEEIERLEKQEGIKEERAQIRVLGVTCRELGIAIAKQWNFPGTITDSMARVDPKKEGVPKTEGQKRQLIAAFSNETSKVIGESDPEDDAPITELLESYRSVWDIGQKKFKGMVGGARKEFSELTSGMPAKEEESPYIANYVTARTEAQAEETAQITDREEDVTATLVLDDTERVTEAQKEETVVTEQKPEIDPEAVLTEGLQEVTAILMEPQHNLNQIFNVVLETIYRALPLQRILLSLLDARTKQFVGRFGFGEDIDELIEKFRFPAKYQPNVFHAAIKNGVDLYIANTKDQKIKDNIPEWFREVPSVGSFLVFPLVVNKNPLGLIYADHAAPNGVELRGNQLNLIKALRNQIVLDIQTRR
jgi:serine/threonine protein kinase